MTHHHYFATCARGLEPVLANELRQLGAAGVKKGRGGVGFGGSLELLYQANLWLRTAIRVLRPILEGPVHSPEELYAQVQTLDWAEYLTLEHTLAVDCNVRDSAITHSHYAALKTKDAICDQFVAKVGRRPNVDVENPMVKLNLHIHRNVMVLSLDASGESLHKRGYRPIQTIAPLNEALAAGLVLLSEWKEETAFVDPMCGSGTMPIEASWIALRRPPGLTRKRYGFQGWIDHDVKLWTAIRDEARQAVRKTLPAPIAGSDHYRDAIALADRNARAAGVGHLVQLLVRELKDFEPPEGEPGVILCNPPYGERIGETRGLIPLYRQLGQVIRRSWGWTAHIFSGNPELEEHIGLPVLRRVPLYNGPLACQLLMYRVE